MPMASSHPTPPDTSSPEALYSSVESYPWSDDSSFQSGLVAILGPQPNPSQSPAQLDDLHLRARCFYYTRKYDLPPSAVDFDGYKAWRDAQPEAALSPLDASAPAAPGTPGHGGTAPRLFSTPSSGDFTPSPAMPTHGSPGLPVTNGTPTPSPRTDQHPPTEENEATVESAENPGYPASFAEIMELIKSGQPIPGIKEIPNTILVGQGTEATKAKRKKPWEQDAALDEQQTSNIISSRGAGGNG